MSVNADQCWYYNFARQFANANETCETALQLAPKSAWTQLGLVESLRQQGQFARAVKQLRKISVFAKSAKPLNDNPQQAQVKSNQTVNHYAILNIDIRPAYAECSILLSDIFITKPR